jgi:hypothetical protein
MKFCIYSLSTLVYQVRQFSLLVFDLVSYIRGTHCPCAVSFGEDTCSYLIVSTSLCHLKMLYSNVGYIAIN